MFLNSIDMTGFKSFAEKTRVEFVEGITVVVGPNGCGKSNVVDAIKWVLGEKKAKNIRGDSMTDVIFSGTDKRKPLSLAEVTLTIDNSDRLLDIDADSVTIGRRVFRDGESEYLINKSPVRLKDIEKLFMDTGIGKSAYSVMEQGKMDLILSTSAEDRRYIFEEAAGISRYKLQKKESLRKLENTGENLSRINDILHEIEREKNIKEKQAEKTSQYLTLRDEYRDADIKTRYLKYRDIIQKKEKQDAAIDRLRAEKKEISKRVELINTENERDEIKKNDIQTRLFEEQKKVHSYKIRLEDIDQKTEKNRQSVLEHQQRIEVIRKRIAEREEEHRKFIQDREKAEQSGREIREKIARDRKNRDEYFEKRKQRLESINNSRDKIENNGHVINSRTEELKKIRQSLEIVVKKLMDAIEKRKAELQGSENERQAAKKEIGERLRDIEGSLSQALTILESGNSAEAASVISSVDMKALAGVINRFEGFEDGFRSILFDRGGIHAEKEKLDGEIRTRENEIDYLREEISSLDRLIIEEQARLDEINKMVIMLEKELSKNETEREWIEKHTESLDRQIADLKRQIANHNEELERSSAIIDSLNREITEWNTRLVEFNERSRSLHDSISELEVEKDNIDKSVRERKNLHKMDEEVLEKINEKISAMDRNLVEITFKKNSHEEYVWTEYEIKLDEYQAPGVSAGDMERLTASMEELTRRMKQLEPINNLAIEEYRELKKRFEYFNSQKGDIEKAREDVLSVIAEINETSIRMFLETFMEIKKNFSDIFARLFDGGEATVDISDMENILESGIDIMVSPPGKKPKNINLLSGGERALTAIALLFATYLVKPSPFCFLDEIDAPLDEENIGRFVRMMKDFVKGTQFVVVSHNKKTMSIGDSIYGVTMEEPGVSKIVSLRMEK